MQELHLSNHTEDQDSKAGSTITELNGVKGQCLCKHREGSRVITFSREFWIPLADLSCNLQIHRYYF